MYLNVEKMADEKGVFYQIDRQINLYRWVQDVKSRTLSCKNEDTMGKKSQSKCPDGNG